MTFKTEPKTWTPIECYLQGLYDNETKDPDNKSYWEAQADAKNSSNQFSAKLQFQFIKEINILIECTLHPSIDP